MRERLLPGRSKRAHHTHGIPPTSMRLQLAGAVLLLYLVFPAGTLVPPVSAQTDPDRMPSWIQVEPRDRGGQTAGQDGPPEFPNNPEPVPVSGALALLALAGGALGVRRLRRRGRHGRALARRGADGRGRAGRGAGSVPVTMMVACVLASAPAFGQTVLVEYSFLGEPGEQTSTAASGVHASVSASPFARGDGLQPRDGLDSINSSSWSTSTTSPSENDYYVFTVTPEPGGALNLTRLEFRHARTASPDGPRSWGLRSSVDGFEAYIAEGSTPTAVTTVSVDVGAPAFQGLAEPVTFRIYGWNAQNSGANSRYRIADFARLEGERVETGPSGWRILSPPVAATVQSLAELSLVQGIAGEYPGAGTNLFVRYNGKNDHFEGGYSRGFGPPAGLSSPLASGRGFIWFLWENAFDPDEPTGESVSAGLPLALNLPGSSPSASFDETFPATERFDWGTEPNEDDGFFLIGNPFGGAFDVGGFSATGLQDAMHRWNPNTASFEVLSRAAGDLARRWDGLFAEIDWGEVPGSPPQDVTFSYAFDCVAGCPPREAPEWHRVALVLEGTMGEITSYDEAAMVVFAADASPGWDRYDASKLYPMGNQWAIIAPMGDRHGEHVARAVESRPLPDGLDSVPVAFSALAAGEFTISLGERTAVPDSWSIELEDTLTGQTVDLRTGHIGFSVSGVTWMEERFAVHVTGHPVATVDDAAAGSFGIETVYPNPAAGRATVVFHLAVDGEARLEVFDVLGRRVAVLADGERTAGQHTVGLDAAGLASGVYVVRLVAGGEVDARRLTIVR